MMVMNAVGNKLGNRCLSNARTFKNSNTLDRSFTRIAQFPRLAHLTP